MTCCSRPFSQVAGQHFDAKKVAEETRSFHENGPGPTTRLIVEGLVASRAVSGQLIDIGAGVGALTFQLLDCGMAGAVDIDASTAYVAAATQEAERLGHSHRIQFVHADFVTASSQLAAADVVTLDRVVCCYPSFDALLNAALDRARAFVALSYPRDVWFVRVGNVFENGMRRLKNNPFRTFVHSAQGMRALIGRAGFDLEHRRETWTWCVEVYARKRGMK